MDIQSGNESIRKRILSDSPFSIIRLGSFETKLAYHFVRTGEILSSCLHSRYKTLYNAGIYSRKPDMECMAEYARTYAMAIKHADSMACIMSNPYHLWQGYFSRECNLECIHSRTLEPFFAVEMGIRPWSLDLVGKKVLIIHPFVESFKKQLANKFNIFRDEKKRLFAEEQDFVFYKTFQTIAGNHIHEDWRETYRIMCEDISKLDFDVALLGCGGYGLPLCDFIKRRLGKSAIYIGGGLQLMFGVFGKRWEEHEFWKKIITREGSNFIRPSDEEQCPNKNTIERGCYW